MCFYSSGRNSRKRGSAQVNESQTQHRLAQFELATAPIFANLNMFEKNREANSLAAISRALAASKPEVC